MTLQVVEWQDYHSVYSHEYTSVVGNIRVAQGVLSPQLHNHRDIMVYLPPSYADSEKRYPVLYMHDGQNLFDHITSYAGEWHVDETMETLSRERGLEGIVVGIPNMNEKRMDEYSPFKDAHHGGGAGNLYLAFLAHTLKPLIDRDFRTLPGKRETGIMGSSMGGLISLYAFFRYADVFGFAGIMSPSLWFARGSIFSYVKTAPFSPGKIYLDAGTRELGGTLPKPKLRASSRRYYASVRRLKRILARKGYRPIRDLLHVEEKWADHSESSWARRLPDAIQFFLESAGPRNGLELLERRARNEQ